MRKLKLEIHQQNRTGLWEEEKKEEKGSCFFLGISLRLVFW